ncbi:MULTISPECIES: site-2 protease family protein [Iodidimonas]|jgi:Zn-dependent protease|nr:MULTISPECIES: site-2 protease family protein [Iodidimonas]GAK32416.1 putative zinc metalloprotease YwhC [alpha proteobacterium Q-1]
MEFGEIIARIAVWVLPVLLAITLHEAAHGYVALLNGDDTAKRAGRVSANPLVHIDPFGTVLLPLILIVLTGFAFGYAKPVPVDFGRLRHPRRDMILVALAGPGANLVMAIIAAVLLPVAGGIGGGFGNWLLNMLHVMVFFNCLIAIFNMLPIPPLDGGRVMVGLLPYALAWRYAQLERFGLFIVVGGLFLLPMLTRQLGLDFDPGRTLLLVPSQWLYDGLLATIRMGL